ncbi:MAG: branched-chain amino acid ABC transporter permease, partial [Gammaproteobacteria bacterium]|nr:branched-chain amino acid ABC transporter permease [Gammaproteobacteria bacterium]
VIMGGYVAYWFSKNDIHPFYAFPAAIVFMFGFGWLTYALIIRRVIGRDIFVSLLATFGLALVLQQALNLIFGSDVQTAESGFPIKTLFGGQVTVATIKVMALVLAGILAAFVVLFMKKSRMGKAIRATAQDARAARVLGVNTDRVYAFTYALNSAICGAAGVLVAMIWVIQPYYGIVHSIRSFIIVVLAGLGNLPGVIFGALFLGSAEQFSAFVFGAEFQVAAVVVILLMVLVYRQIQYARNRQVVE